MSTIVTADETTHQRVSLSVRKNFLWTCGGFVVHGLCQWGILAVMAKFGSDAMLGIFVLCLAITGPIVMFFSLQLRVVQATDAQDRYEFGDYYGLRLTSQGIALLTIVGVMVCGLLLRKFTWEMASVLMLVGFSKIIHSLSDDFYGLMQKYERMDRIAISMTLKGMLSLAAIALGIVWMGSLLWGVLGLVLVWGLLFLCYDIPSGKRLLSQLQRHTSDACPKEQIEIRLAPRWRWKRLFQLAWSASPLGVAVTITSLSASLPVYFLNLHVDLKQVGVFGAISYLTIAGGRLVEALHHSVIPRLAKNFVSRERRRFYLLFTKMLGITFLIGACGIIGAWLFGGFILRILYRTDYVQYHDLFVWMMLGAALVFINVAMESCLVAAQFFKFKLFLWVLFMLVTLVNCLIFIPTWGLYGAAWALIVTGAIRILLNVLAHVLTFPRCLGREIPEGVA